VALDATASGCWSGTTLGDPQWQRLLIQGAHATRTSVARAGTPSTEAQLEGYPSPARCRWLATKHCVERAGAKRGLPCARPARLVGRCAAGHRASMSAVYAKLFHVDAESKLL